MGTSLLRLRQYTDASAQYQQAIALDPEDYSLYLGLGDALNGAGHPKKARIAWKQLAAHSTPSDNIGRQVRQRLAKY